VTLQTSNCKKDQQKLAEEDRARNSQTQGRKQARKEGEGSKQASKQNLLSLFFFFFGSSARLVFKSVNFAVVVVVFLGSSLLQ
jgi:hypothetical protein